jgi:uncharacterized protein YdhG (YjbR/CyaY superfamily)
METIPKPTSVDAYLAAQPETTRAALHRLRHLIKTTVPEAREVISYAMPAYKFHGMLAYFSAFKNHYGLYITPGALAAFQDRVAPYFSGKATLRFTYDQPLPDALIADLLRHVARQNAAKQATKTARTRKAKS